VKSPTIGAAHIILIVQKGEKAEAHKADWVGQVGKLSKYLYHADLCPVSRHPVHHHKDRLMSCDIDRPQCMCGLDTLLKTIPGLLDSSPFD